MAQHNQRNEAKKAKKIAMEEEAYAKRMEERKQERERKDEDDEEEEEVKGEDEEEPTDTERKQDEGKKILVEQLLPQGTTAFIHEKTKEWSVSVQTLRAAVRELGIRHITEEQYLSLEHSNFFDFSTIVSLDENTKENVVTMGPVYEASMRSDIFFGCLFCWYLLLVHVKNLISDLCIYL